MPSTSRAAVLLCAFMAMALGAAVPVAAKVREYRLAIAQEEINLTGRPAAAMTINGGIPGPVLTFTEGDTAMIHVTNRMPVSTSIHWHGLLVPPGMDGVPYISFPPIAPGDTFTYEFPIRQNGTYWYHSHSNLQEQRGLYGAIVIHPAGGQPPGRAMADREHAVVLSDWTDRDPHRVLGLLKRGSHYFALEKGSGQSLWGAARAGRLGDYLGRELVRMPAMDISDVAYDRFLANGEPVARLAAKPGERVKLRIVNGSATTFFHLEFAAGPMTILAADGQDVEPVEVRRLLIAVAETYDVMVTMPQHGAAEFRATAHDGSAYASVWLGHGPGSAAPTVPRPDLYRNMHPPSLEQVLALTPAGAMGMSDGAVEAGRFDQPGMMGGMGHGGHDMSEGGSGHVGHYMGLGQEATPPSAGHGGHGAAAPAGGSSAHGGHDTKPAAAPSDHGGMAETPAHGDSQTHGMGSRPETGQDGRRYAHSYGLMAADVSATGPVAVDGGPRRPWPPYAKLKATRDTSFDPAQPVREIRLTLDGDMGRYVWLLNNRVLSASDDIRINKGEVARFIMINRTMMHHPMHLHGHFFRVVNGQGRRAPLKHTVDVAPMSTTVIEFNANEFGDWFFHCHLLYHMKAGMARVVRYQGFEPPPEVAAVASKLYRDPWYASGWAEMLSNMSEGRLTLSASRAIIAAEWEAGWQRVEDPHWEGLVSFGAWVNRFLTPFVGLYAEGEKLNSHEERPVAGLAYTLPLNLMSRAWVDPEGGWRVELEREFMLAPRLELHAEWRYDSREFWEAAVGAGYIVSENLSVTAKWHSEYAWGAGVTLRF